MTAPARRRPPARRSRLGPAVLLLAVVAVAGLLLAVGGDSDDAVGAEPESWLEVEGLVGSFDPDERFFVAQCPDAEVEIDVDPPAGTAVSVAGRPPQTEPFETTLEVEPNSNFRIVTEEGGDRRAHDVRCLPRDFPQWSFQSERPVEDGLFVITIPGQDVRPWVVVFDNEGVPRWWYAPRKQVLGAQILSDGTIVWSRSFGDGYGLNPRMAHEVRTLQGQLVRLIRTKGWITDAHELYELPNGHLLVNTYKPHGGIDMSSYVLPARRGPKSGWAVFGEAQELDEDGNLVWRWNSRGHVGIDEVPYRWQDSVVVNVHPLRSDRTDIQTHDVFHLNSIEPWGPDRMIISSRHTDGVYGIDRDTGEVEWKLGGVETEKSLEVVGDDPAGDLTLGGQHDVRINEEGVLSIFDNSKDRPRPPRVVFYRLDLQERTATYLGQLEDPSINDSHCCGSARELPDGGWLVYWGNENLVTRYDADGEIAFRLIVRGPPFRAMPVTADVDVADLDAALEAREDG